jgi:hypothetical protein
VDEAPAAAGLHAARVLLGPAADLALDVLGGQGGVVVDGALDDVDLVVAARDVVGGQLVEQPRVAEQRRAGETDVAVAVDETRLGLLPLLLAQFAGRLLVEVDAIQVGAREGIDVHVVRHEVPPGLVGEAQLAVLGVPGPLKAAALEGLARDELAQLGQPDLLECLGLVGDHDADAPLAVVGQAAVDLQPRRDEAGRQGLDQAVDGGDVALAEAVARHHRADVDVTLVALQQLDLAARLLAGQRLAVLGLALLLALVRAEGPQRVALAQVAVGLDALELGEALVLGQRHNRIEVELDGGDAPQCFFFLRRRWRSRAVSLGSTAWPPASTLSLCR